MVDTPRPEHSPSPDPREHSIERLLSLLENASEGHYSLDTEIARYLRETSNPRLRRHYTTSLDAALTLVPEGAWWSIQHLPNPHATENRASASVTGASGHFWGNCKTPALSLCFAGLKARSAT